MMYTVKFMDAKNGGVMTRLPNNQDRNWLGQVAFPGRSWKPSPKAGETWEVTIAGYNAKGTVAFLSPVRKIDARARERRSHFFDLVYNAFSARSHFTRGRDCPLGRAIDQVTEELAQSDIELTYDFRWANKSDERYALERVEKIAREGGYQFNGEAFFIY